MIFVCSSTLTFSYGQDAVVKAMADSLQFLKADTLDCTANLYWRIVAQGEKAIPFLIDKLTDTTQLRVRFHCKSTPLNVGEVSHFALLEIADFPAFVVTHIQFDVGNFYKYLFANENKPGYQKNVLEWYAREKGNYRIKKIPIKNRTKCQLQFGISNRFEWIEN